MTGERVKAIIQMAATLAVTVAGFFGVSLTDNQASLIAIVVAVLAVVAYAVWKNANFTPQSQLGQAVTDALKNGDVSEDAIKVIVGEITEGIGEDGKENDAQ